MRCPGVSSRSLSCIEELREECEHVAVVIRHLEEHPPSGRVRDEILGDLSAAVRHSHAHTAGLDKFLCEVE